MRVLGAWNNVSTASRVVMFVERRAFDRHVVSHGSDSDGPCPMQRDRPGYPSISVAFFALHDSSV